MPGDKIINFVDVSPMTLGRVGKNIVILMKARGISQRKVADACGVSQATIHRVLSDFESIKFGLLSSILGLLDVEYSTLAEDQPLIITHEEALRFAADELLRLRDEQLVVIE